jgi:predicted RNase H-like nuclease (RuvC/YqgF family)
MDNEGSVADFRQRVLLSSIEVSSEVASVLERQALPYVTVNDIDLREEDDVAVHWEVKVQATVYR